MRITIIVEVSTLVDTMGKLYGRFFTKLKAVVHLCALQQWSKEFIETLRNIHAPNARV